MSDKKSGSTDKYGFTRFQRLYYRALNAGIRQCQRKRLSKTAAAMVMKETMRQWWDWARGNGIA